MMADMRSEIDTMRKALSNEFKRTHRYGEAGPTVEYDPEDEFEFRQWKLDEMEKERQKLGINLGSLATTMQVSHNEMGQMKRTKAVREASEARFNELGQRLDTDRQELTRRLDNDREELTRRLDNDRGELTHRLDIDRERASRAMAENTDKLLAAHNEAKRLSEQASRAMMQKVETMLADHQQSLSAAMRSQENTAATSRAMVENTNKLLAAQDEAKHAVERASHGMIESVKNLLADHLLRLPVAVGFEETQALKQEIKTLKREYGNLKTKYDDLRAALSQVQSMAASDTSQSFTQDVSSVAEIASSAGGNQEVGEEEPARMPRDDSQAQLLQGSSKHTQRKSSTATLRGIKNSFQGAIRDTLSDVKGAFGNRSKTSLDR
jgi:hypothetical protein